MEERRYQVLTNMKFGNGITLKNKIWVDHINFTFLFLFCLRINKRISFLDKLN